MLCKVSAFSLPADQGERLFVVSCHLKNSPLCDSCGAASGHQRSPVWALQDTAETYSSQFSQGHQNGEEREARMNEQGLGTWDDAAWRRGAGLLATA